MADLVSPARPLLADPEFAVKVRTGRTEEINTCIACNQACLDRIFTDRTATCMVNPRPARRSSSPGVPPGHQADRGWILSDKDDGKLGDGVKEGDWITKGTPIAQLDDRVILANIAQKKAGLEKLKNLKMQADVDVRVARLEIKRLEDLKKNVNVNVAESEIEKANLALESALSSRSRE